MIRRLICRLIGHELPVPLIYAVIGGDASDHRFVRCPSCQALYWVEDPFR